MIQNFIFDIDGTLINTIDMYMPALIELLADWGYPVPEDQVEQTKHDLFGITGYDALKILGIPEEKIAPMQADWFDRSYAREDRVTVFTGIPAALTQLAERPHTQLAVATSKTRVEYTEHFADRYHFAKLFTTAVTSDDTPQGKPDPAPILLAMEELNAQPEATVYVGDTINDLKAAHAAGAKFAAALYGSAKPETIKAAADFLLETPLDLLKIQ